MVTCLRWTLTAVLLAATASSVGASELAFPAPGLLEGEPDLVPSYVDTTNGDWDHVQSIVVPNSMPGAWDLPARFCESGWGLGFADEDWFWLGEYPGFEAITIRTELQIVVDEIREMNGEPVVVQTITVEPDEPVDLVLTDSWEPAFMRVTAVPQGSPPPPDEVVVFHYRLNDRDRPPAYDLVLDETNDDCAFLQVIPAVYWGMAYNSLGQFWFEGDSGSGHFTDRYDPGVAGGLPGAADGPDVVIELFLVNEPLTVRLEAEGWPAVGYLMTDCGDPAGSVVAVTGPDGTFTFDAPDGWYGAGYYYLVVDGLDGASGPFTLEGEFSYGLFFTYWDVYLPDNDRCDGAVTLGPGAFQVTQAMDWAHNDYDPGVQGCTGWGDTGQDVVYSVAMEPGDVLDVTMTTDTGWDDSIYLVTDCSDPIGSCVAGDDAYPDGSHFTYTADQALTYYLIADSYGFRPGEFTLTGSVIPAVGIDDVPAGELALSCYPNPFNPTTTICFDLPKPHSAVVAIYSIDGRRVKMLVSQQLPAGRHTVTWNGTNDQGRVVASGAYFYRVEAGPSRTTRKIVLAR